MHNITPVECSRIAQDLQIRKLQVESVVQLLNEGNTVPFIAGYRKEATGGLAEDVIRQVQPRPNFLKSLNDRKLQIIKHIEIKGRLTAEVRRALWKTSSVTAAKSDKVPEGQGNEFKPYFQFKESTQDIRPHRILALNRGEKEQVLKVKLEWSPETMMQAALPALADHLLKA